MLKIKNLYFVFLSGWKSCAAREEASPLHAPRAFLTA